MLLKEALELITTTLGSGTAEEPTTDFRGRDAIELRIVSFGESTREYFITALDASLFGYKYFESYHRGGLTVYHVPVEELNTENNWLTVTTPVDLARIDEYSHRSLNIFQEPEGMKKIAVMREQWQYVPE